ncbi:hypothetical protein V500_05963 [Pseudogymnoascus sp. VKM F-4518 (FW-2643)]|nr:hypothetical protein V500_05963 [Pseudogymnoascus sp. VKM F-4518 (FW-2643)]
MASNGTKNAQAPKQVNAPRQVEFMEPKILKTPGRQRPPNLRPLSTTHIKPEQRPRGSPYPYRSDSPYRESPETPNSAISLATPSLAGVRKYYRENGLHTALQSPSPSPLTPGRSRRYSGLSSSGLVSRFDGLHASSPLSANSSPKTSRRSFAEESRDMLLAGTNRSELSRARSVSVDSRNHRPERRFSDLPPRRLGKPPPGRLREYGNAFLGNAATADVFVRAMHSRVPNQNKGRRDSVMSNTGDDENYITIPQSDSGHVVIRARVIPYSKERKPFLIQRRFSKADIEASRPTTAEQAKGEQKENNEKSDAGSAKGDEGAENESEKRAAVQVAPEGPASTPSPQTAPAAKSPSPQKETPEPAAIGPKKRVMLIHMDYALKYLPILGAIMLSGYIRRGDTIDIPLPHPEAWSDTVAYVYTGAGTASDAIKANVAHLAGTVDEGR